MKPGQLFALISGVFFLFAGISGFIPGLVKSGATPEAMDVYRNGFGYLMGLFPINAFHNAVHIIVGISGLLGAISIGGSRVFGRALAIFYGALAIMGLFPYTNTTFGLIPIFSNDVWLHAVFAAIGFYVGFIASPGLLDLASKPQENMQKYQNSIGQS
jgi:hypothetical protein